MIPAKNNSCLTNYRNPFKYSKYNGMYSLDPSLHSAAYLPRHDQPRGSVGDLEDDPSVACTQLTDFLKVIVLQLSHLLLLRQKGLQAFPLLFIQLELL